MSTVKYMLIAYPADKPKVAENAGQKEISQQDYSILVNDRSCTLHIGEVQCEIINRRTMSLNSGRIKVVMIDYANKLS